MIDTAVITAAGYGTRFLPATKNIPKEMLPLIDVPILHEIVKECIDSGITKIIIVTRHGNDAVEDYFDNNKELEDYLASVGKTDRYERFMEVFDKAEYAYVRQHKSMPYGNGSPFLAAKPFLEPGKPFAAIFGDDLVLSKKPCIKQAIEMYEENVVKDPNIGGVVSCYEIAQDQLNKYGIIKFKDEQQKILERLIEKPKNEEAPSSFAEFGRFILTYDIFEFLKVENVGQGNELWLADALDKLAGSKNFYVNKIEGKWFTTGDPANMLRATISYALAREDLRKETLEVIKEVLSEIA